MSIEAPPDVEAATIDADLLEVLSTKAGRRSLFWMIFRLCNLWGSDFPKEVKHALGERLAYDRGVQQVGRTLMKKLQTLNPRAYRIMLDEHGDAFEEALRRQAALKGKPESTDDR